MTVKQNTSALGIWFVARVTICPGFPETILVYPYCPSVMMNRTPSLSEVFSVDGKLYGHPAHGPWVFCSLHNNHSEPYPTSNHVSHPIDSLDYCSTKFTASSPPPPWEYFSLSSRCRAWSLWLSLISWYKRVGCTSLLLNFGPSHVTCFASGDVIRRDWVEGYKSFAQVGSASCTYTVTCEFFPGSCCPFHLGSGMNALGADLSPILREKPSPA